MQRDVYRATIVSARDAFDHETPTIIWITRETNGYAAFLTSYDGTEFLKWFQFRDAAIEYGVHTAQMMREARTESQASSILNR